MAFVIAMGNRAKLAEIDAQAVRGERPRHAVKQLADLLDAEVVQPEGGSSALGDRLGARLIGGPQHWALARTLKRRTLGSHDVIFCPDEAIGLPVAALCGGRRNGPKVAVMVHNIARPRGLLALRLLRSRARVDLFLAVSRLQTDALATRLGVPASRLGVVPDQTDLSFFTPGSAAPTPRPVVMSIGLEQRDYRTLAAATADLDVDVRISGFSRDAKAITDAFPPELPANMTRGFYEWPDLLALYRSSAVVAVSLFPNSYAAGIQALLEAIACGRPMVVTGTAGLAEYLDRPDLVTAIPPGDPQAMRAAITAKLADRAAAEAQAAAALAHYRGRIASERYNHDIATRLRALAAAG